MQSDLPSVQKPTQVAALVDMKVVAVACGDFHTSAITSDNKVGTVHTHAHTHMHVHSHSHTLTLDADICVGTQHSTAGHRRGSTHSNNNSS